MLADTGWKNVGKWNGWSVKPRKGKRRLGKGIWRDEAPQQGGLGIILKGLTGHEEDLELYPIGSEEQWRASSRTVASWDLCFGRCHPAEHIKAVSQDLRQGEQEAATVVVPRSNNLPPVMAVRWERRGRTHRRG